MRWSLLPFFAACAPSVSVQELDPLTSVDLVDSGACGDLIGWARTADGTARLVLAVADAPVEAAAGEETTYVYPMELRDWLTAFVERDEVALPDACADATAGEATSVFTATGGRLRVGVVPVADGAAVTLDVDDAIFVGDDGVLAIERLTIGGSVPLEPEG